MRPCKRALCISRAFPSCHGHFTNPLIPPPPPPRPRPQAADEDDDDDDDGGSGSDDESDIEDKLAGMTELERELFLFERDEQRARERDKKQALQQARKSKEKVSRW